MENARELFQIMTRRFGLLNKTRSVGGNDVTLVQSHILYEVDRQTTLPCNRLQIRLEPTLRRLADRYNP